MMTSTDPERIPDARDLFDVRTKILQQTNPLRAKILVFSLVYRRFDFSSRDWLALKSKDFYELLQKLYGNLSTFSQLEEKLYKMADLLDREDDDEKMLETARVFLKYIHHLYDSISESDLEVDRSAFSDNEDETQLFDADVTEVEWESKNIVFEASLTEREKFDDFDSPVDVERMEDTSQTISYADSSYDLPDSQLSYDDREDLSTIDNFEKPLESDSELDKNRNVKRSKSSNDKAEINPDLEFFKISDRVSDSLFRRMNLQEEIETVVNQQVKDSTLAFQNTLSEVESRIEDRLIEEPKPESLLLKYQALQMLTDKLQSHLAMVKEILAKQEIAFMSTAAETVVTGSSETEDRSQELPLDQKAAKMTAEPMALKVWVSQIDRTLKNRGITTLAKVKNGCLHLIFESLQELNPRTVVAFVNKKIVDLDLGTIERIQVHGRKPDGQSLDWTETIDP